MLVALFIYLRFGLPWWTFIPNYIWNDEVAYLHKAASFAEYGFNTGQYGHDEMEAALSWVRSGSGGPWYPIIYGSFGAIFGWTWSTALVVNALLLTGALFLFCVTAARSLARILLVGVVSITVWPVLIYLPTASYEPLNFALAALVAAVVARSLTAQTASWGQISVGIAVVTLAACVRLPWALFMFPMVLAYARRATPLFRAATAVTATISASLGSLLLTSVLQPPGNHSVVETARAVWESPGSFWDVLADKVWPGIQWSFVPREVGGQPNLFHNLELIGPLMAWISVFLIAATAASWAFPAARSFLLGDRPDALWRSRLLFATTTSGLGLLIALEWIMYIPSAFGRILAPSLLSVLLILVAVASWRFVGLAIALLALGLPNFWLLFSSWQGHFSRETIAFDQTRDALVRVLPPPDTHLPVECRTVVMEVPLVNTPALALPPGYGFSILLGWSGAPIKSAFVMWQGERPDLKRALRKQGFRRIAEGSGWFLESNREAPCK